MKENKKFKFTPLILVIISLYSLFYSSYWRHWDNKETPFISDNAISYWYVPATFIYKDYTVIHERNNFVFPNASGKMIPKYTYGMSVMYAPFFYFGNKLAAKNGEKMDGYSPSYGKAIQYGCTIYGLLGLLFLSFILRRYYSDTITALTIFLVFFATNLLIYVVKESERVHCSLFFLISVFIWLALRWHDKPRIGKSLLLGLVLGLITVVRPTDIIICLIFILYGITDYSSFKQKIIFFINKRNLIFVLLAGFTLVIFPQMLFWKTYGGEWFHYGYGEERFYWTSPKLFKMLFSYRNGWLLYTPIMAFALIGLYLMKKYCKDLFIPAATYVAINLFVLSCWWCWWYMGFGLRSVVQSYPVMSFGLASFLTFIASIQNKAFAAAIKCAIAIAFCFFVFLNYVQSLQYRNCLLSSDGMTKRMYWKSFCKLDWTEEEINEARANFPKVNIEAAANGKR